MNKNDYLEENASQKPALELLQSMGYIYISSEDCKKQRGSRYHVLLKDILRGQLRKLNRYAYAGAENEFSGGNIERAIEDLDEPLSDGLVRTSEKIYDALLLGRSYPETVGEGKMLKLIHKYTIKDGVEDGAIVPLIYEGRFVEQKVDEENIDLWFKQTTKRLTDTQKEDLRKKWSSIRRLTSTDARIKRIALDISEHFTEGYKNIGFKAMLATNYKCDAIRYLKCFEQFGDLNCAVVISPPDMRESVDDADEGTDDLVIAYWDKMMRQYGDADHYEEAIKNKFCDGEIDILIVCSKLLTGFDAPICQVLYIDKELKEHGDLVW